MTRSRKSNWPAIRLAYINEEGSLATLAERFGVAKRTLERRCAKEGWRRAIAESGGVASAVAAEVAAQEGEIIGLTAARLVERTINETERFLDAIAEKLDAGQLDAQSLRQLTLSWRDVVGVGRQAFGLDEPTPPAAPIINIAVLSQVVGLPPRRQPAMSACLISPAHSALEKTG